MKDREIELLDLQLVATYIFIGSLFISILLTYNDKVDMKENKPILTEKEEQFLSIFNRSLVVILGLVFLYINFEGKKIGKIKGDKMKPYNLQIAASELSLISSLIVLYVVVISGNYTIISSVESPTL